MSELFKTENMSLAAFLHMAHPVLRTEWVNQRTCAWVFEITPDMPDLIAEFESGEARVDPVEYNSSYGKLKQESFYDGVWETGRIVFFNADKGYGFVKRENAADGADDIHFHINAMKADIDMGNVRLNVGDIVEFVTKHGPKGERCKVIRLAGLKSA